MRVIVVFEDGDRLSRIETLAGEIGECVRTGTMRHQSVSVEVQNEGELR